MPENKKPAIIVENLHKSFGTIKALSGVDLVVHSGKVLALLGPNGAGKTTLIRILTTLLLPNFGKATVGGFDVVRDAASLRSIIGLAGQYAAVDENLTGRENLELVGRLYHLGWANAKTAARELLESFELTAAASQQVKTYSGGMRKRLDLAASLVGKPEVLFLDEPTTGLDPRSRIELWKIIKKLAKAGTTILLTTQYMEEAEQLADVIVIIDQGHIIAKGTVNELKSRFGGEVLEVNVSDPKLLLAAALRLSNLGVAQPQINPEAGLITLPLANKAQVLAEAIRRLDEIGIGISNIALRRPTLDDVFLALTGHPTSQTESQDFVKTEEQVLWQRMPES